MLLRVTAWIMFIYSTVFTLKHYPEKVIFKLSITETCSGVGPKISTYIGDLTQLQIPNVV